MNQEVATRLGTLARLTGLCTARRRSDSGGGTRISNWTFGTALILSLFACGGGGSSDAKPAQVAPDIGVTAGTSNSGIPAFATWWIDQGLRRQTSKEGNPTYFGNVGPVTVDFSAGEMSFAGEGGDIFAGWRLPVLVQGSTTMIEKFSASDVLRQRAAGSVLPNAVATLFVNGVLLTASVSHRGRYLAGAWAPNGQALVSQRWLSVVDLDAPEPLAETVYRPPGGDSEKVAFIQWISDTEFLVRNDSGRKFYWAIGNSTFTELKSPPATFNGYTLGQEMYAPDGLKYGGLMSKDGGKTQEIWTSNPDYTDMRQVTNAGRSITSFGWVANSKGITYVTAVPNAQLTTNECSRFMINPETATMLNAEQTVASPMRPTNLPCKAMSFSLLK